MHAMWAMRSIIDHCFFFGHLCSAHVLIFEVEWTVQPVRYHPKTVLRSFAYILSCAIPKGHALIISLKWLCLSIIHRININEHHAMTHVLNTQDVYGHFGHSTDCMRVKCQFLLLCTSYLELDWWGATEPGLWRNGLDFNMCNAAE